MNFEGKLNGLLRFLSITNSGRDLYDIGSDKLRSSWLDSIELAQMVVGTFWIEQGVHGRDLNPEQDSTIPTLMVPWVG